MHREATLVSFFYTFTETRRHGGNEVNDEGPGAQAAQVVVLAEIFAAAENSALPYNRKPMTSIREFRCEVCGTVTSNPLHWFVIRCGDVDLTVLRWNSDAANAPGARHYCGEA